MTDGLTKHSRFVVELTAGYVPSFYIHVIVHIFKMSLWLFSRVRTFIFVDLIKLLLCFLEKYMILCCISTKFFISSLIFNARSRKTFILWSIDIIQFKYEVSYLPPLNPTVFIWTTLYMFWRDIIYCKSLEEQ